MVKKNWRARKGCNKLYESRPEFGCATGKRQRDSARPALFWLTQIGPMERANARTGPSRGERTAHA
jgi:hypothetical protein